ncbi:hypothetical protein JCM19237_1023 [Photobacterium aphoticum]|uniref:Uncharacterized protein n=1 Tax=Photobacterium aphoticum TaxID=754436 RepID=A0A090QN46_9GAMM|nr:hypothetical protein JCM19237_1023 [Photobacterium aphoticum]
MGAGLSMLAFGLSSALFGAASHDMAATLAYRWMKSAC